jgi:alkanesulfonate monooxygenase SsuD/methylene tetrahydromethanopterin reductase-like flavin-dependent oxidoreductase (luciferase family)
VGPTTATGPHAPADTCVKPLRAISAPLPEGSSQTRSHGPNEDLEPDPFLPLAVAAEHTTRVELTTAVAIAFARDPMGCAYLANDLQLLPRGRFTLELGT